MPAITIRKFKMNYEAQGRGFPLIFVHGLGGELRNWMFQTPEFSKKYRVFVPDLRGHGQSEAPKSNYTLDAFTEDIADFLKAQGISKCYYVGISMGGMIGQNLAAKRPELIEALVLADTAPTPGMRARPGLEGIIGMFETSAKIAETQGRGPLVDATLRLMFTAEFIEAEPEIIGKVKEILTSGATKGYVGAIRDIFLTDIDIFPLLAGIEIPTLIICGRQDMLTPLAESERINKAIKGAQLEIIENSGHVSNIEQRDQFNCILARFLKKMDSRRFKPPKVAQKPI